MDLGACQKSTVTGALARNNAIVLPKSGLSDTWVRSMFQGLPKSVGRSPLHLVNWEDLCQNGLAKSQTSIANLVDTEKMNADLHTALDGPFASGTYSEVVMHLRLILRQPCARVEGEYA